MKGNKGLIDKLNELLAEELTAVNQYIVHAEMCENWGYSRLHETNRKRSIEEMRHAEHIIERILFLDGKPNVSKLNEIRIGQDVRTQLTNDLNLELSADKKYNEAIRLAVEVNDNVTREMLKEILKAEEEHIDYFEAQLEQIEQMGIENYLAQQVK